MANVFGNNAVLIIAIVVAIAVFGLIMLCAKLFQTYWTRYAEQITLDQQFNDALSDEMAETVKNEPKLIRKWNKFWEKRIVDSGVNLLAVNRENAGKMVIVVDVALLAIFSLIFGGSVLGAFLVVVVANIAVSFLLGFMAEKKLKKLTGQVPAFLSALRAANDTNASTRTSLLQAIGTTPDELHEELKPIEDQLNAGGQIKQVLSDFYNITVIDELRFLMACIILVNESGKDMSEQLEIIQDVVDSRMEVSRHLDQAVASIMPTIWVSTVFIPGMFLYTYLLQPIAKKFWFHSILAWVVFIIILGLYFAGIYMAKHQVDNIKKL